MHKTYPRGATVDIDRGVLLLDARPAVARHGGGPAVALGDVHRVNGATGSIPGVIETDTYREIELDTGGQLGTVLDSADDSEVSVRVGDELLIVSTSTGEVRLTFQLPPGTNFVRAHWGPDGRVAITRRAQDGASLGVAAWADGVVKDFPGVPANWAHWSPDGTRIAASGIHEGGWMAIIDFESGAVTRVEKPLYNPRWSASGDFVSGQLLSGEVLVYRADGAVHMRLNGVCALLGSPWVGEEIVTWGFGEDVRVAMDGTVTPYAPAASPGPVSTFLPRGVAMLDRPGGQVMAELALPEGVGVSWFSSSEGVHSVTARARDVPARRRWQGFCEKRGGFQCGMAPFGSEMPGGKALRRIAVALTKIPLG